uniref:PEHE domain-containing protein n=2 Tax=Steinernema glaseri TaxID=37863 RepID=A0A1I7Z758_9BILA
MQFTPSTHTLGCDTGTCYFPSLFSQNCKRRWPFGSLISERCPPSMPSVFKRLLNAFKGGKKDKKEKRSEDPAMTEFDREITRRRSVHFGSQRTYDYPPEVPTHRRRGSSYEQEDRSDHRHNRSYGGEPSARKRPNRKEHFRSLRRHFSNSTISYGDFSDHDDYLIIEPPSSMETIRELQMRLKIANQRIMEQDFILSNEYKRRMRAEQENIAYKTRFQEQARSTHHHIPPYHAPASPDSPESLTTVMSGAAEINTGMLEGEHLTHV